MASEIDGAEIEATRQPKSLAADSLLMASIFPITSGWHMHGACYADQAIWPRQVDLPKSTPGGNPAAAPFEPPIVAKSVILPRCLRNMFNIRFLRLLSTPDNGRSLLFQPYDQLGMHQNSVFAENTIPLNHHRRESHMRLG